MANQTEIESHYDTLGTLHALRLKDEHDGFPDYTCAFFNGDFTKSLKQAQRDKHEWIFEGLGLETNMSGKRVLDIGCGWGPIVKAAKAKGAEAIGLTLSPGQVKYCAKYELDIRLLDYKEIKADELGSFDAIISIGAFEHFCSVEEYKAGKQEEIYKEFFNICAKLLVPGGRLYLQTMMWGKEVPNAHTIDPYAEDPESVDAVLGRMEKFYPGSWLPSNLDQIKRCAKEQFVFLKNNNGRLDYLETLNRWKSSTKNLWRVNVLPQTLAAFTKLGFMYVTSKDTRIQISSQLHQDQRNCFAREIMSHERMFFEKK